MNRVLPKTEMCAESLHAPEPDEVLLEVRWATSGTWFRSGMLCGGTGRVFDSRPSHGTAAVFNEKPSW